MITISDVAKRAGVSIATVSNVVNKNGKVKASTEEAVQKAIDELGYIPNNIAKGLKMSHTKTIGILVEDISAFSSGEIIDGICEFSEQNSYSINLSNLRVNSKVPVAKAEDYLALENTSAFQDTLKKNMNALLTSRISGLIYLGTYPRDVKNILPTLDIPVVYAYCYSTKPGSCSINYDDFQGAQTAVDYLIKNGHQRIAIISGSINSYPTHKRMIGYQTSLMKHNLPYIPEYIRVGQWLYEDGYAQCMELLRLVEPPTAIFAMSDLMAIGAITAINDCKLRVPDDISVHGFDNLEMSKYTHPALTTIRLPLREIGYTAAEKIIHLIEHDTETESDKLIPCNHIIRDSVAMI